MNNLPRTIKPELIEIGDDIEVTLPKVDGVVHTLRGVVGKRMDHGAVRYLLTEEGYTLLAWEPGRAGVKVTLHKRALTEQSTLFDGDLESAIDEVRRRVA